MPAEQCGVHFTGRATAGVEVSAPASVVATCKLNAVEPLAYLAATRRAILDGDPQNRIEELMPWRFQARSSLAA